MKVTMYKQWFSDEVMASEPKDLSTMIQTTLPLFCIMKLSVHFIALIQFFQFFNVAKINWNIFHYLFEGVFTNS